MRPFEKKSLENLGYTCENFSTRWTKEGEITIIYWRGKFGTNHSREGTDYILWPMTYYDTLLELLLEDLKARADEIKTCIDAQIKTASLLIQHKGRDSMPFPRINPESSFKSFEAFKQQLLGFSQGTGIAKLIEDNPGWTFSADFAKFTEDAS